MSNTGCPMWKGYLGPLDSHIPIGLIKGDYAKYCSNGFLMFQIRKKNGTAKYTPNLD